MAGRDHYTAAAASGVAGGSGGGGGGPTTMSSSSSAAAATSANSAITTAGIGGASATVTTASATGGLNRSAAAAAASVSAGGGATSAAGTGFSTSDVYALSGNNRIGAQGISSTTAGIHHHQTPPQQQQHQQQQSGVVGGSGAQQRVSRRDNYHPQHQQQQQQLNRPDFANTTDRSPSRPGPVGAGGGGGPVVVGSSSYISGSGVGGQYGDGARGASSNRGSPAAAAGGGGGGRRTGGGGVAGRPGGASKSYNTSPSSHYPEDYYHSRNAVPQSISTSAFTVGGGGGATTAETTTSRRSYYYPDHGASTTGSTTMDRGMSGMTGDPRLDNRGMDHHRSTSMPGGVAHMQGRSSRSVNRGLPGNRGPGYHSLDRDGYGDRDPFMNIGSREPRERSLDRDFGPGSYGAALSAAAAAGPYGRRERSLDRRDQMMDPTDEFGYRDMGGGLRNDPGLLRDSLGIGGTTTRGGVPRISPNPVVGSGGVMGTGMGGVGLTGGITGSGGRDPYFQELHHTNSELQRDLANLKKELELTNQKLGSSMHSIKTFWSPELKKERALRKEESAKYSLINDQLKLLNSENQVSRRKFLSQSKQQNLL